MKSKTKREKSYFSSAMKSCHRTAWNRWRFQSVTNNMSDESPNVSCDSDASTMPFTCDEPSVSRDVTVPSLLPRVIDLDKEHRRMWPKLCQKQKLSEKEKSSRGRTTQNGLLFSCFRHRNNIYILTLVLLSFFVGTGLCNSPPRFVLESSNAEVVGGDIVVRLKEGTETPPGTKIYSLKGFDNEGDRLLFGVQKGRDSDLIRVVNQANAPNEATIYLEHELDAETKSEYQLVLTLTDGHLGEGNFITQSMLILVEDINDNAPIFRPYSPVVRVREHSAPHIVTTLEATDRDSGIFGQVVYILGDSEVDGIGDMFLVSRSHDGKGVVQLIGDPDYEKKSVYQLKILATDRSNFGRVNTATAAILVEIEDIADNPPEFVSVPSITRISEDVPRFTEVLQVRAVDGDRGLNTPITYSIVDGPPGDIFAISPDTGAVFTQTSIDRESQLSTNGAVILTIRAREVGGPFEPFVDTEVTIMIEDVNDETPTFRSSGYVCEVSENAQRATPVNFLGTAVAEVFDRDRGTNGTFSINIEGDRGIFEVTPDKGINEASFIIRVRDPTLLDFETLKSVNFSLVARELTEFEPKESRVPVTVIIRDRNDNQPEFESASYLIFVSEDLPLGGNVTQIRATDKDSGQYGTAGIRYTSLGGPLAGFLNLDPLTGLITLSPLAKQSPFDREKSSLHYLTVEARDDSGKGNRNNVELVIHVKDVNDNAPRFDRESYEWVLPENSPDFPIPFFVYADDEDENGTENAEVRYQIIDGDHGGNFTVDAVSGEIRPRGTVDFELVSADKNADSRRFNMTLRAYDLGEPSLFSDVPVTVYITDENDFAPVFENPFYLVSVREDTPEGSKILTLVATDLDGSSPNNDVVYRITSGAKDKFIVDPETGVLSVSRGANLDPDLSITRTSSYFLEVSAFDGGIGDSKLSGTTRVNITIVDVNNKSPIFDPSSLESVTIAENVERGHFVARIVAKDPDLKSDLHYSWIGSESFDERGALVVDFNATSAFVINELSGDVFVIGVLDREVVERVKLFVAVEDVAAELSPQVTEATLEIIIDDVNDNDPVFDSVAYRGSVLENAPVGTVILKVTADDADKNKTVRYSIRASDEVKKLVHVSPSSGDISVGGSSKGSEKIDRELIEWLNFTVKATDAGTPPRSNVVEVSIRVIDQNDHGPEFSESTYNVTVREDAPPGTVIAILSASDEDFGEFGKITYFLDRPSSVGHFKIHPDTGELTVSEALDREEQAKFNLIVQAYDNYQFGFTLGESRHTFCQVIITISDVNDRKPVFEERLPDESCYVITEFHDLAESVLTIRASDGDDPQTPNGQLNFAMLDGNEQGLFRLESSGETSAKIYPNQSLKGHYGNYTLTVQADDRGTPPNSATAQYSICVQDFNDHAPIFVSPPRNQTIRVFENASLDSEVTRVKAVDVDIGSNGAVRYRLRQDPLGNHRSFSIDELTGVITLKNELDRERQKIYDLRVEAHDLGVPTQLQSDLDLTIYVKNVNDNEPQFLIDVFNVNFTENKSPGTERSLLVGTVDRDEDEEFPDDESDNDVFIDVCYFIVGGDDGVKTTFDLHPLRHELIAVKELDREIRSEYTLIVRATEQCVPETDEDFNVEFDPADDTLLKVVVNVLDMDDNSPIFDRKVFTGGIATDDADFGSVILRLSAKDPDENSFLTYALSGQVKTSATSEGLENINRPPFLVDPSNGDISVNFDTQKGMKGYFEFPVVVTDEAGHTDEADVQIYLLRADQRVRFVMRNRPSTIRERINDFRGALSNVTESIVNVDAFEIHENDPTKTDVLLHFVDPRDNSVMDVKEILRIIDYRTEQLDPLFREFNVLHTDGYDDSFLLKAATSETVIILWLIGIIVFQVVLLVVVISLCIHQRKKFLRRLKAAMAALPAVATAPGLPSDPRFDPKRRSDGAGPVFVPNTNKHATEGSNPIWMTGAGYDNVTFGFDDDDIDSSLTADVGRNTFDRLEREMSGGDKDRQLDSLDANILNVDQEKEARGLGSDDDVGYSASHFSGGESTIRVGSTITKMMGAPRSGHGDSPPLRSNANSRSSQSSGLGSASGSSRLQTSRKPFGGPTLSTNGFNLKRNNNAAMMFPTQMPPVDKLLGGRDSAGKRYGFTTYDEDDIPRTEL